MSEDIEKVISDVESSASQCCTEMREKAAELCDSVEQYVRREPMKSVVVASALGLVAGLLLARR
jgi:ElaB/YqjD/DUF883 family membrane-anchored ribosome-binding protein